MTCFDAAGINWSYSKLSMYESCPMRFRLRYIDRLPEPPQPPDSPLERGSRIHTRLERFIKGTGPMDDEAKKIDAFVPMLTHLQALYAAGMATVEDNWYFDADWTPCDRDNVWLWVKLDYNVTDPDHDRTIVGDFKSGRSTYKTIEHVQQLQLYAACAALRQASATRIVVELPYLDEGWIRPAEYTREQALWFVGRFNQRAGRIYADRLFRPNPNRTTCRYCPFNSQGTGACPVSAV